MEASDGQTPDDHGIAFKIQCQSDKELLFRDNKRPHARSLRHWERKLIVDKTRARAMRIGRLKEENQSQLQSISLGQQGYNVKSIRQAAIQGDIVRLQELLDAGFSGDASSAMGLTPLLGASQNGCLDAVKLLLQYDADVNHHHVKSGRTALMEAAARDNSDIVRELLRYGARLEARDEQGETVFNSAVGERTLQLLTAATQCWSVGVADVFPRLHRAAGRTLLLIGCRQESLHRQQRSSTRKELAALRPKLQRSVAEAKVQFDQAVHVYSTQATLVKKVETMEIAIARLDHEYRQILVTLEEALILLTRSEQPRFLTRGVVLLILSFCSRHWFDEPNTIHKHRNRRSKRTQTTVPPTRGPPSFHSLTEDLQKEWEELQQQIKFKCSELKRLQTEEIPDVENGISRNRDGQSLATLAICVVEAEYLPFRDPRSKEPIDPFVRLYLQHEGIILTDRGTQDTEQRLADRSPTWNASFKLDGIGCIRNELCIQVIDAKRKEVAGMVTIPLRSFLDQKERDEWYTMPPTLRQQVLEKAPRPSPARVRLCLQFIHTQSILISREIQQLLKRQDDLTRRKRAFYQARIDECLQKLV